VKMERWSLGTALVLVAMLGMGSGQLYPNSVCSSTDSILDHGYSHPMLDGSTINIEDHRGKVLLFMNTATYWGLNWFNVRAMNALVDKVNGNSSEVDPSKLLIIGFPCNNFGLQEPGQNQELLNGYTYVRPGDGYPPKFPLAEKIEVNGDGEHDMYTHLKRDCPATSNTIGATSMMYWSPVKQTDVSWNFEKFLVDVNGFPRRRYGPTYPPGNIYDHIKELQAETVVKIPTSDRDVKSTLRRMLTRPRSP
jgi:glutathione peroxidase